MGEIIKLHDGLVKEDYPHYYKIQSLVNIIYVNNEGILCEEQWKDIAGYEGRYMISDCGRVKTLKRLSHPTARGCRMLPEKIKPSFDRREYRGVELSKEGINTKYCVHILEAIAFIPNPENKRTVNHVKGNKSDNRWFKLEWATDSEQRIHAIKELKVKIGSPWKNCKKEDHPMYGRTGKNAPSSKSIICNETGITYVSIKDAAQKLNVSVTTLKYVLKGLTKKSKIKLTFNYINEQ